MRGERSRKIEIRKSEVGGRRSPRIEYEADYLAKSNGFWGKDQYSHPEIPKEEIYNLTSQTRRAVDFIALNLSEGSIGQSNGKSKKFIGYSIRSLAEVVTCLHKARRRQYITEEEFTEYSEFSYNLMNMMVGFKEKIS